MENDIQLKCTQCEKWYSKYANLDEGYETISTCPYCKTRNFNPKER